MTWDGGFDRFEKFSFFAKIGRSEVEKVAKIQTLHAAGQNHILDAFVELFDES